MEVHTDKVGPGKATNGGADTLQKKQVSAVVARLREVIGGELGNVLAEGLLLLEAKGVKTGEELERLDRSLGSLRVKVAAATETSNTAEQNANAAKKSATEAANLVAGARTDVDRAVTGIESANKNVGEALEKAAAAVQKCDDTTGRFNELRVDVDAAIERAERQTNEAINEVQSRVVESQGQMEQLERAVANFGSEVEQVRGVAGQASADAENAIDVAKHAEELIAEAGRLVQEVSSNTRAEMENANETIGGLAVEIEKVRTSISPPPPKQDGEVSLPIDQVVRNAMEGKPTPRGGDDVVPENDPEYQAWLERQKQKSVPRADFDKFVARVVETVQRIDAKIGIIAEVLSESNPTARKMLEQLGNALERPSDKIGDDDG